VLSNTTAWVQHPGTVPELLFIRRAPSASANGSTSRWSSHVAFPGGRQEPADESPLYTALRETWEEIGIDLAESDFVQVGRLDEREITTSLGKRLLMILSPFGEFNTILLGCRLVASRSLPSRITKQCVRAHTPISWGNKRD